MPFQRGVLKLSPGACLHVREHRSALRSGLQNPLGEQGPPSLLVSGLSSVLGSSHGADVGVPPSQWVSTSDPPQPLTAVRQALIPSSAFRGREMGTLAARLCCWKAREKRPGQEPNAFIL
ncbi:unnamed protein product [Rangifer tarandus platyrhynchus]|uniref:Uncharacterized protein n=1 Tax=Rangifer tarandus platyrhynchus TaxID=3082113 RepID=A0AC59YQ37_RANTA